MAKITFGNTLEIPRDLVTVAQTTNNDILDLGYQCKDMHPYFKFTKSGQTDKYTKIHPNNCTSNTTVNVYHKDGSKMVYQGTGTQNGNNLTYSSVSYAYSGTIEDIRENNIKMWNLHKPVPGGTVDNNNNWIGAITTDNNYGTAYGIKHSCSLSSGERMFGLKLLSCKYEYVPANTYFRLKDFDGYDTSIEGPDIRLQSLSIGKERADIVIINLAGQDGINRVPFNDFVNKSRPSNLEFNVANLYLLIAVVKDSDLTAKVKALQYSGDVVNNPSAEPMQWGTWSGQPKSWGTNMPNNLEGNYTVYFFLSSLNAGSTINLRNWTDIGSVGGNFPSPLQYVVPLPFAFGESLYIPPYVSQHYTISSAQYRIYDSKLEIKMTYTGSSSPNVRYQVQIHGICGANQQPVDYVQDNISIASAGTQTYITSTLPSTSSMYFSAFVAYKDFAVAGSRYENVEILSSKQLTNTSNWTNW